MTQNATPAAPITGPGPPPTGGLPSGSPPTGSRRAGRRTGSRRRTLAFFGPAFVAAVAYVDPGNFATNFSAGALHGYSLAWVIVAADVVAMLVQYLTSKAGIATGQSLPQLCGARFTRRTNALLWVQAELVAMATDLAEFVGAAIGLYLLFGLPLFAAGLVTAVVSFVLLAMQSRGYRRFEIAIAALLGLVAGGFVADLILVGGLHPGALAAGMVPRIDGFGELSLAVGIIGATVMPHAIYLHSALQARRVQGLDAPGRRRLARVNVWDCVLGLGSAGVVNLAMLAVAAGVASRSAVPLRADLIAIHGDLGRLVGGAAALAFAVALAASGLSSSGVGTYAGQVIMGGFMGWRPSLMLRRVVTMTPSLVILGSGVSTTGALVISQIVLAFGIPFALVPLVRLTADPTVMGAYVNRPRTTTAAWVVAVAITSLDAVLIVSTV